MEAIECVLKLPVDVLTLHDYRFLFQWQQLTLSLQWDYTRVFSDKAALLMLLIRIADGRAQDGDISKKEVEYLAVLLVEGFAYTD